jgi:hypothetical protein
MANTETPAPPVQEPTPKERGGSGHAPASAARRFRIGSNVALQILLAVFIVIMANYIAFKRPPKRWDISRNTKFQLSPMTKNLVGNLQKPVKVIVFSAGSPIFGDISSLLREYEYAASGKKFEVEYVNPFTNIIRAKEVAAQYKLDTPNLVVIDYGGKSKVVNMADMAEMDQGSEMAMMSGEPPTVRAFKGEQVITSTLLELTEDKQGKLYVLAGHGEPDLKNGNTQAFKAYAERQNIKLDTLNLNNVDSIPADATALMIFGPKSDYSERELKLVSDFWTKNGRLFVLLNPDTKTPRLNTWLSEQGIKPRGDYVLRTGQVLARGEDGGVALKTGVFTSPTGVFVAGSDVTKGLDGVDTAFLGHTESLEIDQPTAQSQKINAVPVVNSGEGFWGETDFSSDMTQQVYFDPQKDRKGPFPLAVAAEKGGVQDPRVKVETSRMVVVGNAGFLTDEGLQLADSGVDFAVNTLNWLLKRDEVVGIPPKPKEAARLNVDEKALGRLVAVIFGIVPGAVALIGAIVLIRRRA